MVQDDELYAIIGEVRRIKVKGKIWELSACSIAELPKLQRLMQEFDKINIDMESEDVIDNESFEIMAKIIHMGLKEHHPDVSIKTIRESFSLAALPVAINVMMDLNDFLSGMKGIKERMSAIK